METRTLHRWFKTLLTALVILIQLATPLAALTEGIAETTRADQVSAAQRATRPLTLEELDASFDQMIRSYVAASPSDSSQSYKQGYYFALLIGMNRSTREQAQARSGQDHLPAYAPHTTLSARTLESAYLKLVMAYLNAPAQVSPQARQHIQDVFSLAVNSIIAEEQSLLLYGAAQPLSQAPAEPPPVTEEQFLRDLEDYFNNPDGVDESNVFFGVQEESPPAQGEVWKLDAQDEDIGQASWRITSDSGDLHAFDAAFSRMVEAGPARDFRPDQPASGLEAPALDMPGAPAPGRTPSPSSSTVGEPRVAFGVSQAPSAILSEYSHSWITHTLSSSAVGARLVYAADVDGDGDLDVLSASYNDNKIAWYENDLGASGVFTAYIITTAASGANSVYAADVDGDGDSDALSASGSDAKIAWYENTAGDGSAWTEHTIATDAYGAQSVYTADVDGDGDMDVLSASRDDNKIAWYENTVGDGSTWTPLVITTAAYVAELVYAADVDGDGDVDVLSASEGDDKIAWYENMAGDGSAWTEYAITTAADGARSVYAADVDGDGDMDVLSASLWDDKIAWYENMVGDGSAWAEYVITLAADAAESVYAADVDGDGDLDALSASDADGTIAWYENDLGDGSAWVEHLLTTAAAGAVSVCTADVDGDGDIDILSASMYDSRIAWYENRSFRHSVLFPGAVVISSAAAAAQTVYAADVDGDGDLDALSASWDDDTIAWYENTTSDGSAWITHTLTTAADGAESVYTADVDGDGDLDILSASMHDDTIAWYENTTGDGSTWITHTLTTGADAAQSVYAADVDGDGDLDVLSASMYDNKIAWYENTTGDGSAWITYTITTGAAQAELVYAADVDGDGDLDVLSASQFDNKIAWYENTAGDGSTWTEHTITTNALNARSVYAADMDGDGDVDVLSASYTDDKIAWHENTAGDGSTWTEHTITTAADGANFVYAADVDGDGDSDALSASWSDNKIAWYENTAGDGSTWTPYAITTVANGAFSVYAADVDRDGDMDVLSASWDGAEIAWYENISPHRSASFPAVSVISPGALGAGSVYAADVDGDGDTDALSASMNDDKIAWYENDLGDGSAWTPYAISIAADGAKSVYMADVDGDGDTDALSASMNDDKIAWYENVLGDGSAWIAHTLTTAADGVVSVYATDVDGDGDLDILSASVYDDTIAWYENVSGDGSTWTPHTLTTAADGAVSVYAADVDGDGNVDALSASVYDNTIAWYENVSGDGLTWTEYTLATGALGASSVYAADVDGDGDVDALSASKTDATITWYENTAGDGSTWSEHTLTMGVLGASSVYAADVDSDGDVDVLSASGTDAKIAWYENMTGNGTTWITHTLTTAALGASSVYAADVDSDGDVDVLSASENDNKIAWHENMGGNVALVAVDLAPSTMANAEIGALLGITFTHRGRVGEGDAQWARLGLRLQDASAGALDSAQANAIIEALSVYLDDGSGSFEVGADSVITTVSTLTLTDGYLMLSFAGNPSVCVSPGASKTYFVVVELTSDAWDQCLGGFRLVHVAEGANQSLVQDVSYGTPLVVEVPYVDTPSRLISLSYWDLFIGNPGLNGDVYALTTISDTVYAGGAFSETVARWNGLSWSALPGLDGDVYALTHAADTLYAGGAFTGKVARWNGVGWDVLGNLGGDVYALAYDGTTLYAGGAFAGGIAAWNGSSWDVLGGGVSGGAGAVYAIATADTGDVYVGGNFTSPAANIASWNGSSGAWESLDGGLPSGLLSDSVRALALSGGDLYAGGTFLSPLSAESRGLMRWDGSTWHDVAGAPSQGVNALAANGSDLYVGGSFTDNVKRWNGITWYPVDGGVSSAVKALSMSGSRLYAGGLFLTAGGLTASRVAAWNPPTTDLALSKSASTLQASLGQPVLYTLVVTNTGDLSATEVLLRDELPAGFAYNSASAGCVASGGVVTCTLGALAPAASIVLTVSAQAPGNRGDYVNRAVVAAKQSESNGVNNSAAVSINVDLISDLAVGSSALANVYAGESLTYTLAITNRGPGNADGVLLTDTLPVEVVYETATPSQGSCNQQARIVVCDLGALLNAASASVEIVVNVPSTITGGTILTNTAEVASAATDPSPGDNTASALTRVQVDADLEVKEAKTAPAEVYVLNAFRYNLRLANHGPSQAKDVVLSDTLPAGAIFQSASPGCSHNGGAPGVVTCAVGDLPPNANRAYTISVRPNPSLADGTLLTNALVALTSSADSQPGNNSNLAATIVVTDPASVRADLSLAKSAPATVGAGGMLVYALEAYNAGAFEATNVSITDTLPPGVSFTPAQSSPACSDTAGSVTCSAGGFGVGEIRVVTVTVQVPVGIVPGTRLDNAATVGASEFDGNLANNTDTASSTVVLEADLALSKTALLGILAGQSLVYTLTVANAGPSNAAGVRLTDTLPLGPVFAGVSASQGTCGQAGGLVTCDLGELAAGAGATVLITLTTYQSEQLVNNATISSAVPDPNPGSNTAQVATIVGAPQRETRTYGNLRITANTFITVENCQQALGNVVLGASGIISDYYYLLGPGDSVTMTGDNLDGYGTLALVENDLALFTGSFTADGAEAEPILVPGDVIYNLDKVAGFAIHSDLALTPTLQTGQTEGFATLHVNPPGIDEYVWASFQITTDASIEGSVDDFAFFIAGTNFSMTESTLSDDGIAADSVELTGPAQLGGNTTTAEDVLIAPNKLEIGGSGVTFPLPYVTYGVSNTLVITEASATLIQIGNRYIIKATGTLSLSLPSNPITTPMTILYDSIGNISGNLEQLKLNIAGGSLEMQDLTLSNHGISVTAASYTLPISLTNRMIGGSSTPTQTQSTLTMSPPPLASAAMFGSTAANTQTVTPTNPPTQTLRAFVVTLEEVAITGDGLSISGGSMQIPLPDIAVGSSPTPTVKFTNLTGLLGASKQDEEWVYKIGVTGTLNLNLPNNDQAINFAAQIDTSGQFSGTLDQLSLTLAAGSKVTASLQLQEIAFSNRGLSITTGTLGLRLGTQPVTGTLTQLTIDENGINFGGGSLTVPLPPINLGNTLRLVDTLVTLDIASDRTYELSVAGTLSITLGSFSTSATGEISIDSRGNVAGRIDDFQITVAGLSLLVQDADFDGETLSIASAALQAPPAWGGFSAALYNVKIGPNGLSIGGGAFALPDITVGGVTLAGLSGRFVEAPGGYEISAGGTFRIPGLGGGSGCGLTVGVSLFYESNQLKMHIRPVGSLAEWYQLRGVAVPQSTAGLALKQVNVGLVGCQIAIGSTGFNLTRVEGTLTLSQGSTRIDLGVTVASQLSLAGIAALQGDATLGIQFNPFQMDFAGVVTVFSLFQAAQLQAQVKSGYFSATLNVNMVLFQGQASLTAWSDNGFHLVGSASLTVGFRKGAFWSGCGPWPFQNVCIYVPPCDMYFTIGTEFGEFKKGNETKWGIKGYVSTSIGNVGFFFDSNAQLSVTNIDQYQLVSPPSVARARVLAKQLLEGRVMPTMLSAQDLALLRDYTFTAQGDALVKVNVAGGNDVAFMMTRSGDLPTLTLLTPAGVEITPDTLPGNVIYEQYELTRTVTATVVTDTMVLYSVRNAQSGVWQIKLAGDPAPGEGYIVNAIGADVAPILTGLNAYATGLASAQLNWSLSSSEVTTTLDIYATPGPITATHTITDADGQPKVISRTAFSGFPIAKDVATTLDGALSGVELNLGGLESGLYYIWFEANDGRNPPVRAYAPYPIQITQIWQPSWVAGVQAVSGYRSLDVSWERSPQADVDDYIVYLATEPGDQAREIELGDLLSTTLETLTPNQAYYITIGAVDRESSQIARSETISATPTGAPFELSASRTDFELPGGAQAGFVITLTTSADLPPIILGVTTTTEISGGQLITTVYPITALLSPVVGLYEGSVPDGINLIPATDLVTPTKEGVAVNVVISTTPTLPAGDQYTAQIIASGGGEQRSLDLNITIHEPTFELVADPAALTLGEGQSGAIMFSASYLNGETDPIFMSVYDVPPGLLYTWSKRTLDYDGSVTLYVTDTVLLMGGSYTLTLTAEDGESIKYYRIPLTIAEPGFTLGTDRGQQLAMHGETVTYTLNLGGFQWTQPVSLTLDEFSVLPGSMLGFVRQPGDTPANTLTATVPAQVYLVASVSGQTTPNRYILKVLGASMAKRAWIEMRLDVYSESAGVNLGVAQPETVAALAGASYTYTLSVENYGPMTATHVVLTDSLPAGVGFVSARPDNGAACGHAGGVVTCTLGELARDEQVDVQVVLEAAASLPAGQQLRNVAQVASDQTELDASDNKQVGIAWVVTQADLVVSGGSTPDPLVAGTSVHYTFAVTNTGPSDASQVNLLGALSPSAAFEAASADCAYTELGHKLECNLGSLAAGASTQVTMTLRVVQEASGSIANLVSVSAGQYDPASGDNVVMMQTQVARQADLRVSQVAGAATAGEGLSYQISVINGGPSRAEGVVLANVLPPAVSFVYASPAGACSLNAAQHRLDCNLNALDAGQTAVVNLMVNVASGASGLLTNTVSVSSAGGDPDGGNNSAVASTPLATQADMSIIAADAPDPVVAGQNLTYTLVAVNIGPSDSRGVQLTVSLPSEVSLVSAKPEHGSCLLAGDEVRCSLGNLAHYTSTQVVVVVAVPASQRGALSYAASLSADEGDPRLANNTASGLTMLRLPTQRVLLPLVLHNYSSQTREVR